MRWGEVKRSPPTFPAERKGPHAYPFPLLQSHCGLLTSLPGWGVLGLREPGPETVQGPGAPWRGSARLCEAVPTFIRPTPHASPHALWW